MLRLVAALAGAAVLAGCATSVPVEGPAARSRAPANYESSISSYFDLNGAPPQRRIAVGAPETSPCVLLGGAGRHLGWVVPVLYDTSPATASKSPAKASTGTAGAKAAAKPTSLSTSGTGTVSMEEVSITGTPYYFWFSSDTISGVTRRGDQCP